MDGIRLIELVSDLTAALDRLRIPWFAGGSVASSIHGTPRFTQDIDLAIRITEEKIGPLAEALVPSFYADERQMIEAFRHGRSFNAIHLATSFKVDFFPLGDGEFHRSELSRAKPAQWRVTPEAAVELRVASAEDMVVQKLVWYRDAGCVSDRQWSDLLGLATGRRIDEGYLDRWAATLGVQDLLAKLRVEARRTTSGE